jgi:hypothetical protein
MGIESRGGQAEGSAALRCDRGSARRPTRQPWRMGVVKDAAVSKEDSGQQRRGEAGRREFGTVG